MKLLVIFTCFGSAVLAGCATPREYTYNCTPLSVTIGGKSIASRAFQAGTSSSAYPKATDATGATHVPLIVGSSDVDSFGMTNAWISPANICRQFGPRIVIVKLR